MELTKFLVENISLPEAVEKALDKRTSMGVIGNMGTYTQMQFADSLVEGAASGGGNVAGNAMGMGMGFAMANQMTNQMAGQMAQPGMQQAPQQPAVGAGAPGMPPPPPQQPTFHISINGQQQGPFGLPQLQQMVQSGQLTRDTYVWTSGMASWDFAKNVPALAALFGATPPPPPGM